MMAPVFQTGEVGLIPTSRSNFTKRDETMTEVTNKKETESKDKPVDFAKPVVTVTGTITSKDGTVRPFSVQTNLEETN